ncbi:MAG: hypothetical protein H8E28_00815 [Anaerolineae bacterium]|nr:hypothetical protein [Anaerolineae bacterium]
MKHIDRRWLWGILLIASGILFMLQNMSLIPSAWSALWGMFFGAAGVVFLYAYLSDRSQWWPLIPGLSLLGLAVLVLGEQFIPSFSGHWGGVIFLGGIAVGFWAVYFTNREMWWAVIPAGVLSTLAVVTVADAYFNDTGFIFFLGLAVTFALVAVLPTPAGRMTWAFIPALVLFLLGIFTSEALMPVFNYIWPVGLIVLGGYFVLRNFRR